MARAGGPAPRPLWTCPKCGLKFITKNLWHSCGRATLDDWFARMGPRGRRLYDRFEKLIANCGEYHVSPAKTRIAFLGRVRFAGITRISEDGLTCAFALPAPLKSSRFAKVHEEIPGWWIHRLTVTDPAELDEEVSTCDGTNDYGEIEGLTVPISSALVTSPVSRST